MGWSGRVRQRQNVRCAHAKQHQQRRPARRRQSQVVCAARNVKNRSLRREDVVCDVLTPTVHTNCEITSHSESAARLGPKDTG